MCKNALKDELDLAKQYGFSGTRVNSRARNPYLLLEDGTCLIWIAGKLLAWVTTDIHFGQELHRICWKSSNGNLPSATLSSTETNACGYGTHTRIYYREMCKEAIAVTARVFRVPEDKVLIDHKNHKRGDCRIENLTTATFAQNNRNRGNTKDGAFFTLKDLEEKLASGEWRPLSLATDDE